MNINKIELEKKYKYKDLLEIFEEEKKTGKSKQLQIKNWERCANIEKVEKANFMIHEIYDVSKPKIDNRKGNSGKSEGSRNNYKGIYSKYIEEILTDFLRNSKNNIIYTTNNQLAEICGMVGINYRIINDNRYRFKKYLYKKEGKISITSISDVMNDIYNTIKSVIPSSLRRLEKEGYITVVQDYILSKKYKC